jgi:hypothetical protein
MMWLARRVVALGVLLLAVSASVIVVARQIREPSQLQALGFDVCDGEPCWRGIRPGMDWATVRAMFPDARMGTYAEGQPYLMIDTASEDSSHAYVYSDGASVGRIVFWRDHFPLLITPGEIVARYGSPRCLVLGGYNAVPIFDATMLYSTLRVSSHIPYSYERAQQRYFFRIAVDEPVQSLSFQSDASLPCAWHSVFVLPWRGFQGTMIQ